MLVNKLLLGAIEFSKYTGITSFMECISFHSLIKKRWKKSKSGFVFVVSIFTRKKTQIFFYTKKKIVIETVWTLHWSLNWNAHLMSSFENYWYTEYINRYSLDTTTYLTSLNATAKFIGNRRSTEQIWSEPSAFERLESSGQIVKSNAKI